MSDQGTLSTAAQTAYRWGHLRPEDVTAWADLVNHLAVVDRTEESYGEADLLEELAFPGFDPATDSVAVWDGTTMVAFATAQVPQTPDHDGHGRGYLEGGVRENHRGRGIGRRLMDLVEPRAAELVTQRHPGLAAYLRAGGGLEGSSASAMLARRGYAVVRWYNFLTRPLRDSPAVPAPEGVALVSPGPEHEAPAMLAHNAAFRDHWGSGPMAAEPWHELWTARASRHDVSTLVLSPEGEVIAYVLCGQWVERELYVSIVGTVPSARGRGLAADALRRTISLAAATGEFDLIGLDVDSESLTGATRLYERVGFDLKHQTMAMQRDLPLD
ncbi:MULTISPECIES: GNAT family N-acetyltransferase [unclassified Ornithinimicrobium]|uniref:GNAT family N-acetyltransferase n=1 Tax=unclassified Ornithinimicrobium TaxID=2615080 RepID=UPI003854632B